MKLTPSGNVINVKRTKNSSYKRRVLSAFSSYMYVEKRHSYEVLVRKMLMKLTPSVNFINVFFVRKFVQSQTLSREKTFL